MRTGLMVMASVILSVTYQAGLNFSNNQGDPNDLVQSRRFDVFKRGNVFAFAVSIFIIVFLLSGTVSSARFAVHGLRTLTMIGLAGLTMAYTFSDPERPNTELLFVLFLVFVLAPFIFWSLRNSEARITGFNVKLRYRLIVYFLTMAISIGMFFVTRRSSSPDPTVYLGGFFFSFCAFVQYAEYSLQVPAVN